MSSRASGMVQPTPSRSLRDSHPTCAVPRLRARPDALRAPRNAEVVERTASERRERAERRHAAKQHARLHAATSSPLATRNAGSSSIQHGAARHRPSASERSRRYSVRTWQARRPRS